MTKSRRQLLVALAGIASLLLYAWLHRTMPGLVSAEPSLAGEIFPFIKLLTQADVVGVGHQAAAIRFVVAVVGLVALYGVTLWLIRKQDDRRLAVIAGGAGAVLLFFQLTSPVTLSTDVFAYAYHGRIISVYHDNPYHRTAFVERPDDPYLKLLYGKQERSMYGPVALLVSAGVARLGGEHVGLTILLFRLVAVLAALGVAVLIWAVTRRAECLVFFLWNPLLILEAGLSAHNDLLMVLLVALAVWLHVRGRHLWSVVALGLAVLVKPVAVVLVPLYLIVGWRELRTRRLQWCLLMASAACLGLMFAVYRLVSADPRARATQMLVFGNRYINNVHEPIFRALRRWAGESEESLQVPVWFRSWWVTTREAVGTLPAGTLLVTRDMPTDGMLPVYDPASQRAGLVPEVAVEKVSPPTDPALQRLATGPWDNPRLRRANAWLRGVTWVAFIGCWLVAAWRTRDLPSFLVNSTAMLLALYWLVGTWIWPWYVIWALTLAAFVPGSAAAGLTAILSVTVLSLYACIGAPEPWFGWRSMPAFVLPLVVFAAWKLLPVRR